MIPNNRPIVPPKPEARIVPNGSLGELPSTQVRVFPPATNPITAGMTSQKKRERIVGEKTPFDSWLRVFSGFCSFISGPLSYLF